MRALAGVSTTGMKVWMDVSKPKSLTGRAAFEGMTARLAAGRTNTYLGLPFYLQLSAPAFENQTLV